jgi:hypothetical protein
MNMMTPLEESATLIIAVCPSVETLIVSPDSFLTNESMLDDQNLCIESHSFQTQYNEIPIPVEAIENTSKTREVPSVEEPKKVEINQCLLVSEGKLHLEVDKLYKNHEDGDILCFQTTIKCDDSELERSRTSLETSRTSSFTSVGRKRVR